MGALPVLPPWTGSGRLSRLADSVPSRRRERLSARAYSRHVFAGRRVDRPPWRRSPGTPASAAAPRPASSTAPTRSSDGDEGQGAAGRRRARVRAQPGGACARHPADRVGRAGGVGVGRAVLRRAVLRRHRARGVSTGLAGTRYRLLLSIQQSPQDRRRIESFLTPHHVDGVLLLSLHGDDPLPRMLEERGLPDGPGRAAGGHRARVLRRRRQRGRSRARRAAPASGGRRTWPPWRVRRTCRPVSAGWPDTGGAGRGRRDSDESLVAYGDFGEDSGAAAAAVLLDAPLRTWTPCSPPPTRWRSACCAPWPRADARSPTTSPSWGSTTPPAPGTRHRR